MCVRAQRESTCLSASKNPRNSVHLRAALRTRGASRYSGVLRGAHGYSQYPPHMVRGTSRYSGGWSQQARTSACRGQDASCAAPMCAGGRRHGGASGRPAESKSRDVVRLRGCRAKYAIRACTTEFRKQTLPLLTRPRGIREACKTPPVLDRYSNARTQNESSYSHFNQSRSRCGRW